MTIGLNDCLKMITFGFVKFQKERLDNFFFFFFCRISVELLTSVDTLILPTEQGANFRDLPGVVVGADNVARRTEEQMLLPSGKPMVRFTHTHTDMYIFPERWLSLFLVKYLWYKLQLVSLSLPLPLCLLPCMCFCVYIVSSFLLLL